PDGALLSAGADQSVRLWDVASARQVRAFTGHRAAVEDVAFLPGGRVLSASADGTLRIWDRDSAEQRFRLRWLPATLGGAAGIDSLLPTEAQTLAPRLWQDGGKRVGCLFALSEGTSSSVRASTRSDVFIIYDAATGKELRRTVLPTASGPLSRVARLSARQIGTVLALGAERGLLARATPSDHVALFALETGEPVPGAGGSAVTDVAMAGDRVAVVRQGDPDIHLWD